jgi:hypothetical protein
MLHHISLLLGSCWRSGKSGLLFVSRFILAAAITFSLTTELLAQGASQIAGSQSANPSNRSITIAFWNIQWFPGQRPAATTHAEQHQTEAVHQVMKRIDPDIIGMEEIRNFDKAGLAVQPLRGFKVDVCANFPPREGQNEAQETAIASRFSAISAWAEEWKPAGAATPPRGFAFAAYEVQPRQVLLVYCVHFKSNRGELAENIPIRQESAPIVVPCRSDGTNLPKNGADCVRHRRRFQYLARRSAIRIGVLTSGFTKERLLVGLAKCSGEIADDFAFRGGFPRGLLRPHLLPRSDAAPSASDRHQARLERSQTNRCCVRRCSRHIGPMGPIRPISPKISPDSEFLLDQEFVSGLDEQHERCRTSLRATSVFWQDRFRAHR